MLIVSETDVELAVRRCSSQGSLWGVMLNGSALSEKRAFAVLQSRLERTLPAEEYSDMVASNQAAPGSRAEAKAQNETERSS